MTPPPDEDLNQTPAFAGFNLFETNPALQEALTAGSPVPLTAGNRTQLSELGAQWGSADFLDLGRLANENAPVLKTHDPRGSRLDSVEIHPAWHELMRAGMAAGLHNLSWTGQSHTARAARLFMAYQAEAGHICPLTMTHASMAALTKSPEIAKAWREKFLSNDYDPSFKPWWEKSAVTLGMGMTERQGGTDVRRNTSEAVQTGDHYEITGQKWFMSAPMCDAFLVLAQAPAGLSCFLLPRFRPDGSVNHIHFQRLKNKLGNRSNASSEVEFQAAYGELIGEEGRGIATIIAMVQLTRLDCIIASAGLMRFGLASAVHHARHRQVFQKHLVDQPAMRGLLADMALEVEAVTALAMRVAAAFDRAEEDAQDAAYARLVTPAAKYYVCKIAPAILYEAMECHGGNGYVEELPLARAYREAPVNAIWEGSGNVMALDVLRAVRADPEAAQSVLERMQAESKVDVAIQCREIQQLLHDPDSEHYARLISEKLAKVAAVATLSHLQPGFAEAYSRSRLATVAHATLGASPHMDLAGSLIARCI